MTFLCVYVDGGKGHYVPAKAVAEQLEAKGHKTILVDFFALLDMKGIGRINKHVWKKLLEHPDFENRFSKNNDQNTNEIKSVSKILCKLKLRRFKNVMAQYQPDMIFTTHPYPDYFLSDLVMHSGVNVPVTYYATDVFSVPRSAVCPMLYRMYVATEEGIESARQGGQAAESLRLCPFPLQSVCRNDKLGKVEARRRLGLKENVFTLQINFGGEGVGTTDLLEGLKSADYPIQVVIIGGIPGKTRAMLEKIVEELPSNVSVRIAGFVDNVDEYLAACDIIAGRSGINTLVEAFKLRRPFLITELVYTVMASADYVVKHGVGWNASRDTARQLRIIEESAKSPMSLEAMDRAFDSINITYDAAGLAEMLLEDTMVYKESHGGQQ